MTDYGPKVDWSALQAGVRIYYTGDMANSDGYGTIVRQRPIDPRWQYKQVDLAMDDGRDILGINLSGFQPAPGRRFWLAADWLAARQKRIDQMKAEFERLVAERRI
jgi:hypothetical protein